MNFKEFIEQLMYAVITGILPIFTVYIVNLIKSKISENTSKLQNEQLEKYIEAANEAISLAVISTSQTYVDSIQKRRNLSLKKQKKPLKPFTLILMNILTMRLKPLSGKTRQEQQNLKQQMNNIIDGAGFSCAVFI